MTDRRHMGAVKVTGIRPRPRGVVVHFTSGSSDLIGGVVPPSDPVENSIFWLNQGGLGYQCISYRGVVYELAEPIETTSHARSYNTSHIGVAFKHEGLRVSSLGEGSVPAINRRNGRRMFQRLYDPADLRAMARHCANLLRVHCPDGEILFHDELDPKKNDPGPAFPRSTWAQAVKVWVRHPETPFDFSQFAAESFAYGS